MEEETPKEKVDFDFNRSLSKIEEKSGDSEEEQSEPSVKPKNKLRRVESKNSYSIRSQKQSAISSKHNTTFEVHEKSNSSIGGGNIEPPPLCLKDKLSSGLSDKPQSPRNQDIEN
jgi:hypothetical protein